MESSLSEAALKTAIPLFRLRSLFRLLPLMHPKPEEYSLYSSNFALLCINVRSETTFSPRFSQKSSLNLQVLIFDLQIRIRRPPLALCLTTETAATEKRQSPVPLSGAETTGGAAHDLNHRGRKKGSLPFPFPGQRKRPEAQPDKLTAVFLAFSFPMMYNQL